jgi:poly(A) polymerase
MVLAERKYSEAISAIDILETAGFEAKMAGGCVRDRLLGIEPRDFDVATTAQPDQVCKVFAAAGKKIVPTGFDHGTVTLVMPSGPVEITTLRIDLETFGRHATVALGTSFKEDAARRDFTINAMFEDKNGVVTDFFSGQKDLAAKTLRFVGDPETRIKEDYLRIMRLFRFWARFDFQPAPGTLKSVAACREGLRQISQERITSELNGIFCSAIAAKVIAAMKDSGVLQVIFPEFAASKIHLIDVAAWGHIQKIKTPSDRFAAAMSLFLAINGVDSSARIKSMVTRLKLSKNDLKKILYLFNIQSSIPAADAAQSLCMDFLDRADNVFGQKSAWLEIVKHYLSALSLEFKIDLEPQMKKITLIEQDKSHLRFADLPINTHEMIKILGLQPGPEVGEFLEALRSSYRNEEWFSRPEGEAWLRKRVRITGL